MLVLYSPQVNNDDKINYLFNQDIVTITINQTTDIFDFTGVTDGELQLYSSEFPFEPLFETILPIMPIIKAYKEGGILYVELLKFISEDASEEEKFPEWTEV